MPPFATLMRCGKHLTILARWIVPIIDGPLQKLLRLVLPKLRDRREGLDHRVPELTIFLLDLADIDVLDRVAVSIQLDRSSGRIGDLDLAKRSEKLLAALYIPADRPRCFVDPACGSVARLRVVARNLSVLSPELFDEALVGRRFDRGTI